MLCRLLRCASLGHRGSVGDAAGWTACAESCISRTAGFEDAYILLTISQYCLGALYNSKARSPRRRRVTHTHARAGRQAFLARAASLFFNSERPSTVDISFASHKPAATLRNADKPSSPIADPLNMRIIKMPTAGVAMFATFAIVFVTEPSVATSFPPALAASQPARWLHRAEPEQQHQHQQREANVSARKLPGNKPAG